MKSERAESIDKRVKGDPFCGSILISRPNRNLFWNVVKKYKRNFHPSNASKGENNTSDVPSLKTPKKIR